uniref:Toxin_TOLIP domain-containing protein n=1 Tax=Caenorhabditis tropicalis TaxID=1561998 RepID=A0A1I7UV27_9PELO
MRFKLIFVLIAALLGQAFSLSCLSCKGHLNCREPFVDDCEHGHGLCYTLTKAGEEIKKGCAESCAAVNKDRYISCFPCNQRDHCNGPDQGYGQNMKIKHQRNHNGTIIETTDIVKLHEKKNDAKSSSMQESPMYEETWWFTIAIPLAFLSAFSIIAIIVCAIRSYHLRRQEHEPAPPTGPEEPLMPSATAITIATD